MFGQQQDGSYEEADFSSWREGDYNPTGNAMAEIFGGDGTESREETRPVSARLHSKYKKNKEPTAKVGGGTFNNRKFGYEVGDGPPAPATRYSERANRSQWREGDEGTGAMNSILGRGSGYEQPDEPTMRPHSVRLDRMRKNRDVAAKIGIHDCRPLSARSNRPREVTSLPPTSGDYLSHGYASRPSTAELLDGDENCNTDNIFAPQMTEERQKARERLNQEPDLRHLLYQTESKRQQAILEQGLPSYARSSSYHGRKSSISSQYTTHLKCERGDSRHNG